MEWRKRRQRKWTKDKEEGRWTKKKRKTERKHKGEQEK
jgi:hypothetical protein